VAGTVLLAYTVAYALLITRIDDRSWFDDRAGAMGSLGARVVLSGVVLAGLFHLFDGLRRMAIDLRPALSRHQPALRAAVLFATWACAIPAAAVIIWPWLSDAWR
jgi:succinate dehydrogenase/fumarate reductase cytochrome b subunit